ncbi:MAG: hypothetical protein IJY74_01920 [Oscillospiraceae bacterium]|nr:hypothetical protein [Oscillospiraceae bacterium]
MDDLFGKMQSVLSDPESMEQLKELAALLGNGDESDSSSQQPEESSENREEDGGGFFDIGMLMQLSSLMSSTGQDEDTALLLALKPHLKEERQKKVDKALKLMKLLTVWKTLKDTGALKDFL